MQIPDTRVFPQGKRLAVTFSYDDGRPNDVRLEKLFNRYGVKATFNLNSQNIGKPDYITAEDVRRFAEDGHEIALHAHTHPFLELLSPQVILAELYEDKKMLEEMSGTVITGMAYPYGTSNEDVHEVARAVGVRYSRNVGSSGLHLPCDFMEWTATCHHKDFAKYVDQVYAAGNRTQLYVWGHSYEFREEKDWEEFENCLKQVAGKDFCWYATNGEIERYVSAQKALQWNAAFTKVYNPSCLSVWVLLGGTPVEIKPGFNVLA